MAKLKFDATQQYNDAREMPLFSIPLAAHYLQLPTTTLRSWVLGRNYQTGSGTKRFRPLIEIPTGPGKLLSFFNLAEAHVLSAFRREQEIPLPAIRSALNYVAKEFGSPHPLIDKDFETDGASLFITKLGKLVDASAGGQLAMRQVLHEHLQRIEREKDIVARLYPFTRLGFSGPRTVFIDPRYSFGKPILAGPRIPTGAIAERYRAGESTDDLAADYECTRLDIEEAIRGELCLNAAA